jgi:flagellar protein FliO/FliZ
MAQRLEAALRRPARANDARSTTESAPRAPAPEPEPANAQPQPAPPLRAAPAEAIAPRAEPKPSKSLYDSLEKEMANLLGRPGGKS